MNERVQNLAAQYSEFTGTDRYEVITLLLCKILAGYERYGYLELNSQDQEKMGELLDAMIEEDADSAFIFGNRLLQEFSEENDSVKSISKVASCVGLALSVSPRLRVQLLESFNDIADHDKLIERLNYFILLDLKKISWDRLHSSPEAQSKMMALIVIFELVQEVNSPAIQELYLKACNEMVNPEVIAAVKYFKGFDDTDYIYYSLRKRLPDHR